jgi:hypothetical protein
MVRNNYTDSFEGEPYSIASGKPLSAAGVNAALNTREKVANKTANLSGTFTTDDEYPSAKAVNAALNTREKVANKTTNLSGTFTTDDEYPSAKAVNAALVHKTGEETIIGVKTFGTASAAAEPKLGLAKTTDAANDGTKFATEAQVYKVVQAVAAVMASSDILPAGTILAISTGAWASASATFKSKWKVCDGTDGTPDLRGRFLRGGTAGDQLTGSGKMTLGTAHLPVHKHTASISGGSHAHDFVFDHNISNLGVVVQMLGTGKYLTGADAQGNYLTNNSGIRCRATESVATSSAHSHTVTIDDSTGGGQAFDVIPAFYTVIYVMKVA